jgi:hypothetical protein
MSSNQVAYAQKRRSSRIDKAIPLAVQGVGAFRAPYREEVTTQTISCHGCTYQMKEEVLPGDVVFLDMGQLSSSQSECLPRARVKWIQKLKTTKDQVFEVAVELETAGNIWGIASPPEDWLPVPEARVAEPANLGRDLRVVPRAEPRMVATPRGGVAPVSHLKKNETTPSLSPLFSELMVGLGEQIQIMASETAAATLAKEKSRLLEEFRVQLRDEATRTLERVIATSKEALARRALKELNEAQEATARTNYDRWIKTIDTMTASTIVRLQRSIEASCSEGVDHFMSRLRGQVAPVLEEAKVALQKLAASEAMVKEESQAIYARFANQLESCVNASLTKTHEELDKRSAAVVGESKEKLLKLSQGCEKAVQDNLRSLVASATDYTKKILKERSEDISRHFSAQLDGYIRSYLESISKSIAEIPKKTATHSND